MKWIFNRKVKNNNDWYRWFAWYPAVWEDCDTHKINIAWLITIERKNYCDGYNDNFYLHKFRWIDKNFKER